LIKFRRNLKAVLGSKVQLVTPLFPGAIESQEFASPEVREKVGLKVAVEEALLELLALEVADAVDVEDATGVIEALPDRVPETTLSPELEGEPRDDLSQHVPEPLPPVPPTYVKALHFESASHAVIQSLYEVLAGAFE
jgi:hypothetical protein